MNDPCTALTLNYRDALRTVRCVRSLLREGLAEVLVWDNSDDCGLSGEALQTEFCEEPRVRIVLSPRGNVGFAAGVNAGLEEIRQRYGERRVLLINNDAELLAGAWQALQEVRTPGGYLPAVVVPWIRQADELHGLRYYHRLTGMQSRHPLPGSFPYASGCCLLLDPSQLPYPLFDEDFFMYGEDCALGYQLSRTGVSVIPVAHAYVLHEGTASSGLGSEFYETRMVAAHIILASKLGKTTLSRMAPLSLRLVLLPARAVVRAWRYASWIPLRALYAGAMIAWNARCDKSRQDRNTQL